MKHWICTFAALGLGALALILFTGCDKANEPDVPQHPYRLINSMMTDGYPEDVKVGGNYVAVANGTFGAFVLDKSRLDSLHVVLNYVASPSTRARHVAIDIVHSYLGVQCDPGDAYQHTVFNIAKAGTPDAVVQFTPGFSSQINEFDMTATSDTVVFWATDYTPSDLKLCTSSMVRPDSLSNWDNANACADLHPTNGIPRGFDIRSDKIIAVANDDGGLFLYDASNCSELGAVDFSGVAYDCAWYSNYVVVASDYLTVIVDATDLRHPQVVASLTIPTADRLRKVAIDGTFACVLDEYDGVYVIDISNPRNPQYVQLLNFYDGTAVAADNGKLFCTAGGLGLLIYSR